MIYKRIIKEKKNTIAFQQWPRLKRSWSRSFFYNKKTLDYESIVKRFVKKDIETTIQFISNLWENVKQKINVKTYDTFVISKHPSYCSYHCLYWDTPSNLHRNLNKKETEVGYIKFSCSPWTLFESS